MKQFRWWSFLADTLQIIGSDWKSFIVPSVITFLTGAIGFLSDIPKFWLAVGVLAAFALTVVGLFFLRVWKREPDIGMPVLLASIVYTDPFLRQKNKEAMQKWVKFGMRVTGKKILLDELKSQLKANPSNPNELKKEIKQAREELEELESQEALLKLDTEIAHHDVERDFYGQLIEGKLVAVGYPLPMKHGTPPVDVPGLEWTFLRFDWDTGTASGQGISYHVIWVRQA